MAENTSYYDLLLKLTEHAKNVFGDKLKKVVLYGSYARGDFDTESDIDVMIMVDMPPEELSKYRKLITYFCADMNVENSVFISPKLQSTQLFDKWKNVLPFYKNVINEGINVYG